MTDYEPDETQFIPRHYHRPWEVITEGNTAYPTEQIENLRRTEIELTAHGSELSFGRGSEPPFVTRQAAQQQRYATPDEGGRYHGKTPPIEPCIRAGRHRG
jgi:hypothetical protein